MPLCERTRYQKQASTVRNMRAVLKMASWGTRRIFGSIRCKKQAFSGTEEIFGVKNSLLWYATHLKGPQNSRLQPPAAPDASSVPETAPLGGEQT